MNIVHSGSRYMVYGEDIRTYHDLPVGSYDVDFSKMTGFFLSDRSDLVASEEKVYGSTPVKVAKVMSAYQATDRNFGVLLSGQKGIGKSLFVRVLAEKAVEAGFPVLVVGRAIPGIAGFLSSIDQECVVVFDEFEKTFAKNDDYNPQDEMLSLFDGIDGGHKMFVVTCNDVGKLSEYMLNRPGRFHYHFIMKPPTSDEITEYLIDNIKPEYATLIPKIASLVGAIDLPYDHLRALAFEINHGSPLSEAFEDLNISRPDDARFDVMAYRRSGRCYEAWGAHLHFTGGADSECVGVKNIDTKDDDWIRFSMSTAKFIDGVYVVEDHITSYHYDEDDFPNLPEDQRKAAADAANNDPFVRIALKRTNNYARTGKMNEVIDA